MTHVPSHRLCQKIRGMLIFVPVTVGLQKCLDRLLDGAFLAQIVLYFFLFLLCFLILIFLPRKRSFLLFLRSNLLGQ